MRRAATSQPQSNGARLKVSLKLTGLKLSVQIHRRGFLVQHSPEGLLQGQARSQAHWGRALCLPQNRRRPRLGGPGTHMGCPYRSPARSVAIAASAWTNSGLSFNDGERCTVTPLVFPYSRNATSIS